jgi:hypothetical protein
MGLKFNIIVFQIVTLLRRVAPDMLCLTINRFCITLYQTKE